MLPGGLCHPCCRWDASVGAGQLVEAVSLVPTASLLGSGLSETSGRKKKCYQWNPVHVLIDADVRAKLMFV